MLTTLTILTMLTLLTRLTILTSSTILTTLHLYHKRNGQSWSDSVRIKHRAFKIRNSQPKKRLINAKRLLNAKSRVYYIFEELPMVSMSSIWLSSGALRDELLLDADLNAAQFGRQCGRKEAHPIWLSRRICLWYSLVRFPRQNRNTNKTKDKEKQNAKQSNASGKMHNVPTVQQTTANKQHHYRDGRRPVMRQCDVTTSCGATVISMAQRIQLLLLLLLLPPVQSQCRLAWCGHTSASAQWTS